MSRALSVDRLDAWYGDSRALRDVTLHVEEGEVVAVIGPNGAGKTTLLRAIAGLHPTKSGSISTGQTPIQALPAHRIVEQGVVLVPEGRRLFGGLSVVENLEVGAYTRRARGACDETLQSVLEIFPLLAERKSQLARTMSGGQQQMLAIARALMGLPRLLMLDEPSLGLAPMVVTGIFQILRRLQGQGVTILLVEQNARQALALADRAYVLEEGAVAATGTGVELRQDDRVREAYLGAEPGAWSAAE
jgi:branched-chain amino acid transport system ATP-binding protein